MHVPAWHVSFTEQLFPSLHAVPLALFGFEQIPVAGLHVPASWHWSCAAHTTGLAPVHAPDWHVSDWVHAFPSSQALPFALLAVPHMPAVQTATRHALPGAWQSAAVMHPTHWPAPSHFRPAPQGVWMAVGVWTGTLPLHVSSVQGLPSSWGSAAATVSIAPAPSHWFTWQSPIVWAIAWVPAGTKAIPQTPMAQVRDWHSVSSPGHWSFAVHSAHWPAPSQNEAPPAPQGKFDASGGLEGTPWVQTSAVHSLPSTGTSPASSSTATAPA